MDSVRVIYFGHYWRSYGGTEFDLRTMLRGLAERGHECMAITYDLSSHPGTPLLPVEVEGVQCIRSDYDVLRHSFNIHPNIPKDVFRHNSLKHLRNNIRAGDILLTCFTPEKEAWAIAKTAGARVIQKYSVAIGNWKRDDWPEVDLHVFNSHSCERSVRRIANIRGPSAVIYPEIDIQDQDLWNPEGAIGLVNPAHHKGIYVFYSLAKAFPDERFISAGGWAVSGPVNGPANHSYMRHMKDMREFYGKLKLLLCPTQHNHNETFGRTVLEAMKYGIPVMASWKDGIPEAAGGAAKLVRAYSSDRIWAVNLKKILEPGVLEQYHKKSLKRAKLYNLSDILGEWESVFRKVQQ
jgi:glycosyltransferase involved in cell wall biosynthesis